MRRILLDQNAPLGLRKILIGHDVRTAFEMGWDTLANGVLLAAAERGGFDIMVTSDQNIRHQQNLTGCQIALVVLTTNRWLTVRSAADAVLAACMAAGPGTYSIVNLPLPPRRRTPSARF